MFNQAASIGSNGNLTADLSTNISMYNKTEYISYEEICDISKIATIENISYTLFLVIMLIACVVGNGLVILATAFSEKLRSRVTVYFIVSLACSDLLFGITIIPYVISMEIYNNRFCHGIGLCYVVMASDVFINVASMLNLLLIATDRFIAINIPFMYHNLLTFKNAKILIACVWTFSLLWTTSGLFSWNSNATTFSTDLTPEYYCRNENPNFYTATYFGIYLISFILMSVFYLKILHVAIQQIRSIEALTVTLAPRPSPVSLTRSPNNNNNKKKNDSIVSFRNGKEVVTKSKDAKKRSELRKTKRELKATKSVAIVFFSYAVCWFPNLIINTLLSTDTYFFSRIKSENVILFNFIYYLFIQILPIINFMLNPIIYSFSNKQFRAGFKQVFTRMLGRYISSNEYSPTLRRDTRGISLLNLASNHVSPEKQSVGSMTSEPRSKKQNQVTSL